MCKLSERCLSVYEKGGNSMQKKIKLCLVLSLVVLLTLVVSVFASEDVREDILRWTGLSSCSTSLTVKSVGAFKTTLTCHGTTTVYNGYYAGVIVYLETLDDDGDWVTVTAWSDYDSPFAAVSEDYKVSAGTYRLSTTHRSYTSNNYSVPYETHYMTSNQVVTH